jgi:hypothetical protein
VIGIIFFGCDTGLSVAIGLEIEEFLTGELMGVEVIGVLLTSFNLALTFNGV